MPNFTIGTGQFTYYWLDPSGPGAWYAERSANEPIFQIRFATSGRVNSARPILGFDTFRELLLAMIANSIALPQTSFIDVDQVAIDAGIADQFEAAAISDAELRVLNTTYGAEALCKSFGILAFVRRYYLLRTIDLAAVSRIFYNWRDTNRVGEDRVRVATDFLLNGGDITQAEYDNFWNNW